MNLPLLPGSFLPCADRGNEPGDEAMLLLSGLTQLAVFIQIGVALWNFTVYARTPPYQNYGHMSSSRIPGLYSIDRIKMADDHDVK